MAEKATKWGVYRRESWGQDTRLGSIKARTEEIAMAQAAKAFPARTHVKPLGRRDQIAAGGKSNAR